MDPHLSDFEHDERPLVLVVDHDPKTIALLSHLLRAAAYRSISAEDGPMGISIAEKYKPDLIILDLEMPEMDGCATCKQLKARPTTADIPVLFATTAERTDETISHWFGVGAHDFITKPFNRVDLLARLRVILREQAVLETYRSLATEDPATGLGNRRQFIEDIRQAIAVARREATDSILLLTDIDSLTTVNDRHGHDLGDELILTFARLLKRLTSNDARPSRIGDDDFGLVLTRTSKQRALALAERLTKTFAAIVFDAASDPKHFTAGLGLACYAGEPANFDIDDFIRQADAALYAAKTAAPNRIVAHWQLDPDAIPTIPAHKRHSRAKTRCSTHRAFVGAPETEPQAKPPTPPHTCPPPDHSP